MGAKVYFVQRGSPLVQIVLHGHNGPLRLVLVHPDGTAVRYNQVRQLLDSARQVRNAVAHNRSLTDEHYHKASRTLVQLLKMLRFDVPRALLRIEAMRRAAVEEALKRMGASLSIDAPPIE